MVWRVVRPQAGLRRPRTQVRPAQGSMQQVEVADVAGAGDDDGTDTDAGADDGARDKHTTASTPLPGRLLGQTQASVLARRHHLRAATEVEATHVWAGWPVRAAPWARVPRWRSRRGCRTAHVCIIIVKSIEWALVWQPPMVQRCMLHVY